MFKFVTQLIIFISFFFLNNLMAFANKPEQGNSFNLTIQMRNLSQIANLPKHDFAYVMAIPQTETYQGNPLEGAVSADGTNVTTVFYRLDNNIDVNLKITDPAMGKRIIWQGKVTYDRSLNTVDSIPQIVDACHYDIKINVIQPREGRPQFIIGIVSI